MNIKNLKLIKEVIELLGTIEEPTDSISIARDKLISLIPKEKESVEVISTPIDLHPDTNILVKEFIRQKVRRGGFFTKQCLRHNRSLYFQIRQKYALEKDFIEDIAKALGIKYFKRKNFKGEYYSGVCMGYHIIDK